MYKNSKKQKFTHPQDVNNSKETKHTNMNFKHNNQRHNKPHKQNTSTTKSTHVKRFGQKHKRVMGSKVSKGQRHR